jgi:hypothetical protein
MTIMGIIVVIGILVGLGVCLYFNSTSGDDLKAFMAKMPKPFEDSFGYEPKYYFLEESLGVGLSNDFKSIALVSRHISKVYNLDQLRGHEISDVKPGGVWATGNISVMQAAIINSKMKAEAKNESGLFIKVKDIDNPEWYIKMDSSNQKRWHEILNQLYEGTLS